MTTAWSCFALEARGREEVPAVLLVNFFERTFPVVENSMVHGSRLDGS